MKKEEYIPTEYEKEVVDGIEYLRNLPKCPQCDPKQGSMLTLNSETGEWICTKHGTRIK